MVQGGLLRPEQAGRCRLLELPDEEQHRADQHPHFDGYEQRQLLR